MNKQFGEDNPSSALDGIRVETVNVAERRYHTAFPVSADASNYGTNGCGRTLSSVATGTGPFPVKNGTFTRFVPPIEFTRSADA